MGFDVKSIKKIESTGSYRFEHCSLNKLDYLQQSKRFREDYGVELPKWQRLPKFGRIKDLRFLCDEIGLFIKFADGSWIQFIFYPGFTTDLASVPWQMRSLVDNDDGMIIKAVLPHDFLFSTHGLPFDYTNKLFYGMCRFEGYSKFQSKIAYYAVNSIFGKKRWAQNKQRRESMTRLRAEMIIARHVDINGKVYDDLPRIIP